MVKSKGLFNTFMPLLWAVILGQGAFAQNGINPTADKPKGEKESKKAILKTRDNTLLYIGSGYNFLSSNTKSQGYLNNAIGVNASIYQPLVVRKVFTFGIHIGAEYGFSLKNNFPAAPDPFHVTGETSSTVAYNGSAGSIKQSAFKIEVGPQLNIHLGDHFVISPAFLVGGIVLSQSEITADQTTIANNILGPQTYHYTLLRKLDMTAGALTLTPKLRFHYLINDWIGLWVEANYTIAPTVKSYLSRFTPQDTPDSAGRYDRFQLDNGTYATEQRKIQYTSIGVGGGLVFSFGRKKQNKPVDPDVTPGTPFEQPAPDKPRAIKQDGGTESISSHGGETEGKSEVAPRVLISINPKTNSTFKDVKAVGDFTWQILGEKIAKPEYLIEVQEQDGMGKQQRTFSATTTDTKIDAYSVFKEEKMDPGQYTWKVTEKTTGLTSNQKSLTFPGSCGIDSPYISIRCDKWNETTGLPVYTVTLKQKNVTAPPGCAIVCNSVAIYPTGTGGTISNISPPLPSITITPGSTGTITFSYSPPNLSTTSVMFKTTGVWQDALQNSVNTLSQIDTLPNCLCKDCDSSQFNMEGLSITSNGPPGNQYNITGSVVSNKPVWGVEFQVQSYSYSAEPVSCSNGIAGVEQSGMFLMPASTINGIAAIQVFNETVSGLPASDNNASKDIKLISTAPLYGPIPVNLAVGLPGPLVGLADGCCKMKYKVCLLVKVYYDKTSCKSCLFTKCFEFKNY